MFKRDAVNRRIGGLEGATARAGEPPHRWLRRIGGLETRLCLFVIPTNHRIGGLPRIDDSGAPAKDQSFKWYTPLRVLTSAKDFATKIFALRLLILLVLAMCVMALL